MNTIIPDEKMLRTTIGDFPLDECRLKLAGREWKVLHAGSVLSRDQEAAYLLVEKERLPYGVTLWASAIALASEIAARGASDFRAASVLELGAGTGLPGIIAASAYDARVMQTDRSALVLSLCGRNAALNGVSNITQSLMDWTTWSETAKYEWIIGSDILYADEMHPHLVRIFESNLAQRGRVLLSDPFRETSFKLFETLETEGWRVSFSKWNIGEGGEQRPIGVFELAPPRRTDDCR